MVFGLGLESGDLSPPSIVGFEWAFGTWVAELAGIAIDCFGRLGLVVQARGRSVGAAWAGHHFVRWAQGCVVALEVKVLGGKSLDIFAQAYGGLLIQRIGFVFVFSITNAYGICPWGRLFFTASTFKVS